MEWRQKLSTRLKACPMSLADIGRKAGVPYSTIQKWINGTTEPKVESLAAVVRAAQLSLDDLFDVPVAAGHTSSLVPMVMREIADALRTSADAHDQARRPAAAPEAGPDVDAGEASRRKRGATRHRKGQGDG